MVNLEKKDFEISVIDIGARYGLHPSWKKFNGNLKYFLIEADKKEYLRLKKKYKKFSNIKSLCSALGEDDQTLVLNIFQNPAMSSFSKRKNVSPLYWVGDRKKQSIVTKQKKMSTISLNSLIKRYSIKTDFLKLDVEGHEIKILKHGANVFQTLIGGRSEVSFLKIFNDNESNEGTFSNIHKIFIDHNFVLLNLDYEGKGDYYSKFLKCDSKFGALQNTDAVWIKNPSVIVANFDQMDVLKSVIFCILNNSIDLAFWLLENTYKKYNNFKKYSKSKNLNFIKHEIIKHFYSLKWIPAQNIKEHRIFFEKIFNCKYPEMNKFNEQEDFNPY